MINNEINSSLENKKREIPLWLSIVLICVSSDTYIFGTITNNPVEVLPRIFAAVFTVICALFYFFGKIKATFRATFVYAILIVSLLISGFSTGDSISRIGVKCLCISVGFFVAARYSLKSYAKRFCDIIYVLTIFSLVVEAIAYLIPSLIKMLPLYGGSRIHNLFVCGVLMDYVGTSTVRNTSIFWEPGVFQMYIILAVLFQFFLFQTPNTKKIVVYILGLVTTFSTTGYLTVIWIVACFLLKSKPGEKTKFQKYKMGIAMFMILGVTLMLVSENIYEVVFGKLFDSKNGSMNVRLASFINSIEIFLDHPKWGAGMSNISSLMYTYSLKSDLVFGFTSQNTNTLFYQYAAHGALYGAMFTIGNIYFSRSFKRNALTSICVFVTIVLMYTGENLAVSFLPYLLIFFGLQKNTPAEEELMNESMEKSFVDLNHSAVLKNDS